MLSGLKNTHRISTFAVAFLACSVSGVFLADQAWSQSIERNPFSVTPAEQRLEIAQRERIQRLTQDIVKEEAVRLESLVSDAVERRLAPRVERQVLQALSQGEERTEIIVSQILSEFAETIPLLVEEELGRLTSLSGTQIEDDAQQAEAATIPSGWTFVACVDRKALYRDETGKTFYVDEDADYENIADCRQ